MSSLRLGLKRSLSGQDDSNDIGGMEVAAITQQPAAKKKKAASLKPRAKTSPKTKPKAASSRRKSSSNAGGKSSSRRRKGATDSEGGAAEDESSAESAHGEDDSEDDEPPAASKAARGRQQQQQLRTYAAVEEDEEDSDSDEEDYDDGYGSDLTGLPEVERERILLERYQKRQERREQLALRRRMQMNKGVAADSLAQRAKRKAAMERAAAASAAALEDVSSGDSDEDNDNDNDEDEGEEDGAVVQEDKEEEDEDDSDEPPDHGRRSAAAAEADDAARETSAAVLADEEDDDSDEGGGEKEDEDDKDDDDSAPVRGGVARAQGRGKRSAVTEDSEDSDEEGDRNMDDGDDDEGDARGETRGRGKEAAAKTMESDEDEGHGDGKQSRAREGKSFSRRNKTSSSSADDDSDESYEDSRYSRGATASSSRGGGSRDRYRRSSRSRSRERRSRSRDRSERRGDRGYSRSRSRSAERGRRGGSGEAWRPVEPEPTLDDINKCRVPRDYLERWSNEPFFEKAVQGCFVRVSRGTDREGRRLYAMAEIVGVGPYKRRYKIGNTYTTKCLKISSSTAQLRDQCMDIVSNSRFTEEEYTFWKEGRKSVKAPTLTESQCAARRACMTKIVQGHKYSVEEVSKMVKERQKDGVAFKNIALSRITLSNSLEAAIANGKEEEADFCREQLAKLDEREAQKRKSLKAGAAGLKAVNERAKLFNVHTDASVGKQKRLEEAKRRQDSAAGVNVKVDPFQRRSCRPKILWSVGRNGSAPQPAGDSGEGGVEEQKQSSPMRNGVKDSEGGEGGEAGKKDAPPPAPRLVGLQKMHSFEGVDVLEAGKMALEKRLGATQPKAAPRQGGKLTIGTYLQKARPPVDA